MKNWKNRIILSGCIFCVIFGLSGGLSLNFTIESFWEDGSIINFEIEYNEDIGSIIDYEYEIDGIYEYNVLTDEQKECIESIESKTETKQQYNPD
ncbi:MAG: hypothetical protein ACFFC6_02285, partial [Promethearchaeota archaeon]